MRIHIELDDRKRKDGTVSPRLYLYDGTEIHRKGIDVSLKPSEWDKKASRIRFGAPLYAERNAAIERELHRAKKMALEHPHLSARALKERLSLPIPKADSYSLADMIQGWIDASTAKGTVAGYAHFKRILPDDLDLRHATDHDVQAFFQRIPYPSKETRWTYQKHLNKAIRQANKKLGRNLSTITGLKVPKSQGEILEWSEIRRLLDYTPKDNSEARYQTIAAALVLTGIRIGDLHSLLGTLDIRGGILCAHFHCQKPPHTEVSPIIFPALERLLVQHGIPTNRDLKEIRDGIRGVVMAAGVSKYIRPHDLRHSFVTNFLDLGVVPEHLLARVFTGHRITGQSKVFHGYNRADLSRAQKTVVRLLELVEGEQTCGVLGEKVA
jgi:integrase